MADAAYLRAMRERAARRQDWGQVRALDADLARMTPNRLETTAVGLPERAVPAKPAVRRAGRPPKPRCEHDRIVGRCVECEDE